MSKKSFRDNGVVKALLNNIPAELGIKDIPAVKDALMRVVETIPTKPPAFYPEDYWDFSKCFKYTRDPRTAVDFRRCHPEAKTALKDFAVYCLERGNKVTTVSNFVANADTLIRRLINETGTPFALLDAPTIIGYIDRKDTRFGTKMAQASLLIDIFTMMTKRGRPHLVDIRQLDAYHLDVAAKHKHEATNHYKPVPEQYMDLLVTMLDSVMRDDTKPYDQRMTAGIMLVDTQLGMRTSEISIMPAHCVRYADTTKGKQPYVVYRSRKTARAAEVVEVEHMGTDLLYKTLDYYFRLRERSPYAREDFLYVDGSSKEYPIDNKTLQRRFAYLVKLYMPEAKNFIEGVDRHKFRGCGDDWFIPSIHCLRTTVFSAMANHNIPYAFIEKMMSHTPGSMCDDGYYAGVNTPENDVWDNINNK